MLRADSNWPNGPGGDNVIAKEGIQPIKELNTNGLTCIKRRTFMLILLKLPKVENVFKELYFSSPI